MVSLVVQPSSSKAFRGDLRATFSPLYRFDNAEIILSLFVVLENEAQYKWLFWPLLIMIFGRKVEILATKPYD